MSRSLIFRSSLLAVALGLASAAQATLLIGFNSDFNVGTDTTPQNSAAGFSGSLSDIAVVGSTGTTSDQRYGNSSYSTSGESPTNYRVEIGTNPIVFSVTNSSGSSYALESLLFDAIENGPTTTATYTLSYKLNGGSSVSLGQYTATGMPPSDPGYFDYAVNLASLGLSLANGSTIQFYFAGSQNSGANPRLDNIGLSGTLTPIPEPATALGLGLLLGSPVFLRVRRRKPARTA